MWRLLIFTVLFLCFAQATSQVDYLKNFKEKFLKSANAAENANKTALDNLRTWGRNGWLRLTCPGFPGISSGDLLNDTLVERIGDDKCHYVFPSSDRTVKEVMDILGSLTLAGIFSRKYEKGFKQHKHQLITMVTQRPWPVLSERNPPIPSASTPMTTFNFTFEVSGDYNGQLMVHHTTTPFVRKVCLAYMEAFQNIDNALNLVRTGVASRAATPTTAPSTERADFIRASGSINAFFDSKLRETSPLITKEYSLAFLKGVAAFSITWVADQALPDLQTIKQFQKAMVEWGKGKNEREKGFVEVSKKPQNIAGVKVSGRIPGVFKAVREYMTQRTDMVSFKKISTDAGWRHKFPMFQSQGLAQQRVIMFQNLSSNLFTEDEVSVKRATKATPTPVNAGCSRNGKRGHAPVGGPASKHFFQDPANKMLTMTAGGSIFDKKGRRLSKRLREKKKKRH